VATMGQDPIKQNYNLKTAVALNQQLEPFLVSTTNQNKLKNIYIFCFLGQGDNDLIKLSNKIKCCRVDFPSVPCILQMPKHSKCKAIDNSGVQAAQSYTMK
jgi:hypothetical protein